MLEEFYFSFQLPASGFRLPALLGIHYFKFGIRTYFILQPSAFSIAV